MKYIISILLLSFSLVSAKDITTDEMISQMIIVGFSGQTQEDKWIKQIQNDIENNKIGGVILFARNIKDKKQLIRLTHILQASNKNKLPIFIGVDQEGGVVQRMKKSNGFIDYSSAYELAQYKTLQEAFIQYDQLSSELFECGFNLNFAPVVDLNINKNSPIIGMKGRSYSDKEEIVVSYASEFINAMHKNKILSVLKHFPGHGSANADSHVGITDISKTWKYEELKPYFHFINANKTDMIMVGHLTHKTFDDYYPATLSKNIVTGILRNKLKYEGVIISDDLLMKAIIDNYTFEKTIVNSIQAGVDILLFSSYFYNNSNTPNIVHNIINSAIKKGEISEEMIRSSYDRIMKLKNKLNKEES